MDDDIPQSTFAGFGRADRGVSVRVVHSAGLTRVKYAPKPDAISGQSGESSNRIFTAGDDFLVRILPEEEDNDDDSARNVEPLLIDDATRSMTWIDADQDYLVTASEDGCIRIYQHSLPVEHNGHITKSSPTDLVCILARCGLPTRCAALERSVGEGKTPRVAVCSDELIVKVIDAGDPKRVQLITGHQRGVRAASWCPKQAVLATSSSDATVKLWDLQGSEPTCIASLEGVISASKSDSELSVEAVWHPSGTALVLPAKTHEIVVIAQERASASQSVQWRKVRALSVPNDSSVPTPTGEIACMAFCPNGRYLAAATTDGQVTIWEWSSKRPVRSKKADSLVTSISWHPSADTLSWADNAGQLNRWNTVLGSTMPSPFEYIDAVHKQQSKAHQQREEIDALFDGTGIVDDEIEDAYGAAGDRSTRQALSRGQSVEPSPERARPRRRAADDALLLSKKQPRFQPTATPMRNSRRYLAFNMIGSLVAIDQNTHQSILFEPHDAGSRRKWRFVDNLGFDMASIGANGALFACPEQEADDRHDEEDEDEEAGRGTPATIHFKPFEMPGVWEMPGSEWSAHLPKGEAAVAIAMGGRRSRDRATDTCTAVVATSRGYLRFFTGAGLQRYIWSFGNQVVTMAAGVRFLLVVHRNAPSTEGNHNLRYSVIDLATLEVRQEGALPLATDATLIWAGFNSMDSPAVFDNTGMLMLLDRVYYAFGQARWTPALDTKTLGANEAGESSASSVRYWPVGLDGSNLLAVMLKGQAHPDASSSSRPLIQEFALSIPVIDAQGASGMLEEQVMRQVQNANLARSFKASLVGEDEEDEHYVDVLDQPMAKPTVVEHEADKALLQIIQLACKTDKHQRVLDAARELHSVRTLDAAMQIGTFFHLSSLVDRMDALRDYVADRRERDERLAASHIALHDTGVANSRILAASSPSPALHTEAFSAKRALASDFANTSRSQKKSYGSGRRSDLAKAGHTPSSPWHDSSVSTSAIRNQASDSRNRQSSPIAGESDQEDTLRSEERGSPHEAVKRRPEMAQGMEGRGSEESERASKRTRDAPTSPFANKTNRSTESTTGTFVAPAAPPVKKNPFARTAGMTRDRSMHKSNSFFERVDNVAATAGAASSGRTVSGRTKQATLLGMIPRGSSGVSQLEQAAATPAFGESADEDSQPQDSESLQLTLTAAQRQAAETQQLEETQYADEDEETQQMDERQDSAFNDEDADEPMTSRFNEQASIPVA